MMKGPRWMMILLLLLMLLHWLGLYDGWMDFEICIPCNIVVVVIWMIGIMITTTTVATTMTAIITGSMIHIRPT